MKNDKNGDECIEMNIKTEAPFHILISDSWLQQEVV